MGKAKKRNFNKCVKSAGMLNDIPAGVTRAEAIDFVSLSIKNNKIDDTTKNYIGLFGITPEELTEAGISYESLIAHKNLFL